MSLKIDAYAYANPMPKTTNKFYVMLPGCPWSLLRVSSAEIPNVKHNPQTLSFLGKNVPIPGSQSAEGSITVTYQDDLAMTGLLTLKRIERFISNKSFQDRELLIFITDEFTGVVPQNAIVLKNVWISNASSTKLDWSTINTVNWSMTFHYSTFNRWY